jgi:rhodanese-related sulfurtransferase
LAERNSRTLFVFDLRPLPDRPLALLATGGQLIQATDEFIGTRNARIVLIDDVGVRAANTAAWLRQMGWQETVVLIADEGARFQGIYPAIAVPAFSGAEISPHVLFQKMQTEPIEILDISESYRYVLGHISGASFAKRRGLQDAIRNSSADTLVITSEDGAVASFAVQELPEDLRTRVQVLTGGNAGWVSAGKSVESGIGKLLETTRLLTRELASAAVSVRERYHLFVEWELERFLIFQTK